MGSLAVGAVLMLGLASQPSLEQQGWKQVSSGPVAVWARPLPGARVKEVRVEADLSASVLDIQDALQAAADFPRFMPCVQETHPLGAAGSEGTQLIYTRLQLPWLGQRDYVLRVQVDQLASDLTGTFHNQWESAPNAAPLREGIGRIRLNQGSWTVTGLSPTRSHVIYQFAVDPGGWVPAFVLDDAAPKMVSSTLKAVEREAQRRGQLRQLRASLP